MTQAKLRLVFVSTKPINRVILQKISQNNTKKVQKNFKTPNCLDPAYFIFHKPTTSKDGWSCDIRLKRKRLMSNLGVFGTYTGKISIVVAETSILAAEGSPGS